MREDEINAFLISAIPSVWALELLVLLRRIAPEGRRIEDLVGELRSSTTAVSQAVTHLGEAGLIIDEAGIFHYRPASPKLEEIVREVETLYELKPGAVIKVIITANHQQLRLFADAFRWKD